MPRVRLVLVAPYGKFGGGRSSSYSELSLDDQACSSIEELVDGACGTIPGKIVVEVGVLGDV